MVRFIKILSCATELVRAAGDLLMPEICLGCQTDVAASHSLCPACMQKLLGLVG